MITNQAEYDAAKAKLHNMPLHTNELLLASMEIEKQLLEYRRQNGFFEVGDFIIISTFKPEHQFHQISKDDVGSHWINLVEFRHATNAEIKAQRRLDLPESVVQSLGEIS
jgi:hypothetical protein